MSSTSEVRRPLSAPKRIRYIGLPLGLLFLFIALNRPTIANMRFHDLTILLATGACLGAGLAGAVVNFVLSRQR